MLVPTWMGTNMADGNQQKHLLPSIGTKEWIYSSRNSYSYKMAQDYEWRGIAGDYVELSDP